MCMSAKAIMLFATANALLMATKDCAFLRLYEELYKLDYRNQDWYYNAGELPQYALLDQYPGIAYLAEEGVQQGMVL